MKPVFFALIIVAVCFNPAFGVTDIIVSSEDTEWLNNNVWKRELVKSDKWNLQFSPAPAIEIIVSSDNLFWSDNNLWKTELVKSDIFPCCDPEPSLNIIISSDNLFWSDNNIWKSNLISPDIQYDRNKPPVVSAISDQTTKENTPTSPISFTVSDDKTEADDLIITGSSSDTEIVPDNNIIFGGSGNNRTVTVTPAANKFGVTSITVKVTDAGKLSTSVSFNLTVQELVPAAIFTATPSFGPPPLKVSLDASASYSSGSSVTSYSWSSSDDQTASGKTASMTFNSSGSYIVTLTIKDGNGKTASAQKTITVKYPVCQYDPFNTTEYNAILQELKKGEYESSVKHKQRLENWNNEKHTYCFEMDKFKSYDADRGVLFARILTDPLQITPVIYEIKIESIGTGKNVADFISNMYTAAAIQVRYGATESDLHLYLSEDSIQIEPESGYSSARKIIIIEDDRFYEEFIKETEKKWYETTSEWETRIASYKATILADIITQPENLGYGYDADKRQMKISIDLSRLNMGIKEYILIDMDKNSVIPFLSKGWATVTIRINQEDLSIEIIGTEIRMGELLLNYIEIKPDDKGYTALTPPTDIEAMSGADSVKITWKPCYSAYLKGYNLYRSMSESGPWSKINTKIITGDYYKDSSSLTFGKTYYYCLTSADSFNNESMKSDVASAIFGYVKFFIPDSRGKKGNQVKIPVNIANSDGIRMSSADIYVTYNPAMLSVKGIEKTAISSCYSLSHSLYESGTVKAVITSNGDTLYGDASFFYIIFNVIGDSGTSELKFNPEKTFFYKYNENNTTAKAALDLNDTGIFTADGSFIMGDLDGDGIINSNDIVTALHIAVGKIDPTREKLNAGDVSGDGRIMANDASLITRIVLDLPLAPASSASRNTKESASKTINVYLPDITVSSGGSIWVPVKTDNAENIAGGDIIIKYDPSFVTATGSRKTSLTENFDMQFNIVKPGYIQISFSSSNAKGLSHTAGTLAELQFTAKSCGVSPITLSSVRLNDTYGRDFASSALQISVISSDGSIKLTETGDADHSGSIDLKDAVLCLKILVGINEDTVYKDADVNCDEKIGLEEVVYILQKTAKIR